MKKAEREKIKNILMQNQVPTAEEGKISELKRAVYRQMEQAAWRSLPKASWPDRLLRQIPYVPGWIWVVQLAAVFLFAEVIRQIPDSVEMAALLFFTGPVLALLPVAGLVKSYGCNMWEMEAACRYDLRQITAMRMCIVGTADIAVLAAGAFFYGMKVGSIWEFGLLVLVPFLASSSIYLWELERFSRRSSGYMLAATGIVLNVLLGPGIIRLYTKMCEDDSAWFSVLTIGTVIFLAVVAVWLATRLYRDLGDRKGVYERWSLE